LNVRLDHFQHFGGQMTGDAHFFDFRNRLDADAHGVVADGVPSVRDRGRAGLLQGLWYGIKHGFILTAEHTPIDTAGRVLFPKGDGRRPGLVEA
jgi:hypothetical protein